LRIIVTGFFTSFLLLATALGAGALEEGLLRDGFALAGVDGKVSMHKGDGPYIKFENDEVWLFEFESDVNDYRAVVKAGTKLQLLPSSDLEKIIPDVKAFPEGMYRLRGRMTKYKGRNYIFGEYFLPIVTTMTVELPEPNEPVQPQVQEQPQEPNKPDPADKPNEPNEPESTDKPDEPNEPKAPPEQQAKPKPPQTAALRRALADPNGVLDIPKEVLDKIKGAKIAVPRKITPRPEPKKKEEKKSAIYDMPGYISDKVYFVEYHCEKIGDGKYKFSFVFDVNNGFKDDWTIYLHGYVKDRHIILLPENRRKYKFDNWTFWPKPATSGWPKNEHVTVTLEISAKPIPYNLIIGFWTAKKGNHGKQINLGWVDLADIKQSSEKSGADDLKPTKNTENNRKQDSPPAKKVEKTPKPERRSAMQFNSMLTDRMATLLKQDDGPLVFALDAFGLSVQQTSLRLLPCEILERTEGEQIAKLNPPRFKIAGIKTKYKGAQYLLLQKATRIYGHGNFGR